MSTDPPEGYVSAADACRLLRISDRTLRRRVQAGTIDGEYVARPQGSILYVRPPAGVAAEQAAPDGEPREAAETWGNPAGQAAVVAALLDRLDSRDAALLAATERAARAEAERDAAQQAAADLAERLRSAEERLARPSWWARLWGQ